MENFKMMSLTNFRLNALANNAKRSDIRISIPKEHPIFASFASIERIGLFNTGGIPVELVSISKHGALLNTAHHSFIKSFGKELTVKLFLNGKCFSYQAVVVRQDAINNLYGIKFSQSVEAIDNYLTELNIYPCYGLSAPTVSSVWLDLESA
jgi:hypothetical protein